jgi:probable F420-dependent oxidoreductase
VRARLGISLPLAGHDLRETIELARRLEQLGLADLWSSEAGGYDAFTSLAAAAVRTSSIRLGTAIVPAYTRPPALLAMTAATLAELSGGRFCLGVGSSTEVIVGDWMGLDATRPLSRVKETVEAFRLALAGGKVDYTGRTLGVHGFRLQLAPAEVPVMVGALGPRMFRLAGEVGDGVVMTIAASSAIETLLADFRVGAEAAGKATSGEVVLQQWVQLGSGSVASLREIARSGIAAYGVVPVYNRYFARQGFESEAHLLQKAWEHRSREEARHAITDEMVDSMCILGDVDHVLVGLEALQSRGVTTILLGPLIEGVDVVGKGRMVAGLRTLLQEWNR